MRFKEKISITSIGNHGGMGSARPKNGDGARSPCVEDSILSHNHGPTEPVPRVPGMGMNKSGKKMK
jgi:hypothetical protein